MREKEIEQKLKMEVNAHDGICWKFVSPGTAGVPDRIILMPKGKIAFVEVKTKGEKPRPLQLSRHRLLKKLGFNVYILDDVSQIGRIIDEIQGGVAP